MICGVRKDVYQTAAGPQEHFCACDGRVQCLYHWFYETKSAGAPTHKETKEKLHEQFPGRQPQRDSGKRRPERNPEVAKPAVRGNGAAKRNRSGRPFHER